MCHQHAATVSVEGAGCREHSTVDVSSSRGSRTHGWGTRNGQCRCTHCLTEMCSDLELTISQLIDADRLHRCSVPPTRCDCVSRRCGMSGALHCGRVEQSWQSHARLGHEKRPVQVYALPDRDVLRSGAHNQPADRRRSAASVQCATNTLRPCQSKVRDVGSTPLWTCRAVVAVARTVGARETASAGVRTA